MLTLSSSAELHLKNTLFCGQCFRWREEEDGSFFGVADGRAARLWERDGMVYLESDREDDEFWPRYFGLELDYRSVVQRFRQDRILKKCLEYGAGIRVLLQPPWETTLSFILSANNNIPRIRRMIETLCVSAGDKKTFRGREYFTFPSAQRLAGLKTEDLALVKAGYRDKYVIGTAKMVAGGQVDFDAVAEMDTRSARRELCRLPGVGPKVADCILLFGFARYEVFPKDVWTKRILQEAYHMEDGAEDRLIARRFGQYAGIAQQYLYYYFRENA